MVGPTRNIKKISNLEFQISNNLEGEGPPEPVRLMAAGVVSDVARITAIVSDHNERVNKSFLGWSLILHYWLVTTELFSPA